MNFMICSSCKKNKEKERFEIVNDILRKTCLDCKERRLKYNVKTYEKCLIYSIECLTTGDIYIGSTKLKLNKRLNAHKSKNNKCVSKEIIERDNYKMNVLEELSCENQKQLLIKEREYVEKNSCINKQIPTNLFNGESQKRYKENHKELVRERQKIYDSNRDKEKVKEQCKKYYEKNKEKCSDYKKKWYLENRERILQKLKDKN